MQITTIFKKTLYFALLIAAAITLRPITVLAQTPSNVPTIDQCKAGSPDPKSVTYEYTPNHDGTSLCHVEYPGIGGFDDFNYDKNGQYVNGTGFGGGAATGHQIDKNGTQSPSPVNDCTGWHYAGNLGTCVFRGIVSGLGAVLISITGWLMGMAGILFNWIVFSTVVQFGQLFDKIAGPVTDFWTATRDFTTILFIGAFAAVAFAIMLDLKEYGQKKYIARLLIVAVLVNFSFLFTKMTIDFSNYLAYQVYQVAWSATGAPTDEINASTIASSPGITGTFIRLTGVQGIQNVGSKLAKIADDNDNGWVALLHGLVVATLYFMTAAVLLYGSYVLVVRAALIILLLVLSAAAFFSFAVPGRAFQKVWDTWWSSLIKVAVLAPTMMLMLTGTALIAAQVATSGQTLANLAGNSPTVSNASALFSYFIVLALLFASFKISSMVANSIAGFNIPGAVISGATRGAVRVGSAVASVATGNPAPLMGANAALSKGSRVPTPYASDRATTGIKQPHTPQLQSPQRPTTPARTGLAGAALTVGAGMAKVAGKTAVAGGQVAGNVITGKSAFGGGQSASKATTEIGAAQQDLEQQRTRLRNENPQQYGAQVQALENMQKEFKQATGQLANKIESVMSEAAKRPVTIDADAFHAAVENSGSTTGVIRAEVEKAMQGAPRDQIEDRVRQISIGSSTESVMSQTRERIKEAKTLVDQMEMADPGIAAARERLTKLQEAVAANKAPTPAAESMHPEAPTRTHFENLTAATTKLGDRLPDTTGAVRQLDESMREAARTMRIRTTLEGEASEKRSPAAEQLVSGMKAAQAAAHAGNSPFPDETLTNDSGAHATL